MVRSGWIPTLLFCCVIPSLAFAGERLEVRTLGPDGTLQETGWMYLEAGNLFRLDPDVDPQGHPRDNSIIFHADSATFIILDPVEKDYLTLDPSRIRHFSSRLREQLENMRRDLDASPTTAAPPDAVTPQPKAAEAASQQRVEVRKVGEDEEGTRYEVSIRGRKVTEVWVKPPAAMGLSPAVLGLIRETSAFYESFMKSLAMDVPQVAFADDPFAGIGQMNGFPTKIKDLSTGEVTRIGVAQKLTLDPALFEPPADYTERALPPRQ